MDFLLILDHSASEQPPLSPLCCLNTQQCISQRATITEFQCQRAAVGSCVSQWAPTGSIAQTSLSTSPVHRGFSPGAARSEENRGRRGRHSSLFLRAPPSAKARSLWEKRGVWVSAPSNPLASPQRARSWIEGCNPRWKKKIPVGKNFRSLGVVQRREYSIDLLCQWWIHN